MRLIRATLVVSLLSMLLSSCAFIAEDVNVDLPLPEAKARTQATEREIADALPDDLVLSIDQNETGSFLSCSQDGGEQWAGGLTAIVRTGASARRLLDPVEQIYAQAQDLVVSRWESDGDSILEVVGPYRSTWIVRYDPGREEVHVSSFSPCIRLPDDVWREAPTDDQRSLPRPRGCAPPPRSDKLTPQVHTGPMIDAGELRRTQPGTEGASLPANLSGTRTASIGPLWKEIRVHRAGSADGESRATRAAKLSGP